MKIQKMNVNVANVFLITYCLGSLVKITSYPQCLCETHTGSDINRLSSTGTSPLSWGDHYLPWHGSAF